MIGCHGNRSSDDDYRTTPCVFHFLDALRTSEPTSESLFGKEAGVKGIVSVLMLFVTQDALSDMKQRRCSSLIYYYSFY